MIHAKIDFGIFNLETREFEFKDNAEAEKAIARIRKGMAAAANGGSDKPKKNRNRISVGMLHDIKKVERMPRITFKELSRITKIPESTLKNNKKVRAIVNKEKADRKKEAEKRYTDAVFDRNNDQDD